eukprot:CAMPEP_0172463034 /NCGR_PEP_ID=MMETSP1065-20121228/45771_1 /TAXON_ID=265537 /ORGANISM="Amphiprora paludosa, Strain CCMP125" /LENGTH=377 /DNA_ID=CAMNT_0013218861 /DNA_START=215 /DNA_END=1348 /DNA_ORIENTATION=-
MVFLTSWLVLLGGVEFSFTPWGIVSGFFWVPGGTATVYAIKTAGLAIGIGVGSCFIVLVSFVWGVYIFREHVHSHFGAVLAIGFMMAGVMGMAYFSSPESAAIDDISPPATESAYTEVNVQDDEDQIQDDSTEAIYEDDEIEVPSGGTLTHRYNDKKTSPEGDMPVGESTVEQGNNHSLNDNEEDHELEGNPQNPPATMASPDHEIVCGMKVAKRHLGMAAAALFTGVWGGSILVPMKWADSDKTSGVGYLISFGIGASLVTILMWVIRWVNNSIQLKSMQKGYEALPSFHLRVMWLPGGLGGLLWSIGNFFSLISVKYLGEGVGYPLVQTAILVSGLWGIFYFQEITGVRRISYWFSSASLAICGILLLSYEHHAQ